MDPYLKSNRDLWDAWTELHERSELYDVEGFKQGKFRLNPFEKQEVGDVRGKTLLHLQCHFGLDTLSWVNLGAIVTGADFSEKAIALARRLSEETGIPATFVCSNIYDLPEALEGQYDIVFTSHGVLGWLPDIDAWAKVVAHFLKPGLQRGRIRLEPHPIRLHQRPYQSGPHHPGVQRIPVPHLESLPLVRRRRARLLAHARRPGVDTAAIHPQSHQMRKAPQPPKARRECTHDASGGTKAASCHSEPPFVILNAVKNQVGKRESSTLWMMVKETWVLQ
jgi:SAM-dependent methyltransferase